MPPRFKDFWSAESSNIKLQLCVVAIAFIVYWPCMLNGFVPYDDNAYIYYNPHVAGGFSWLNVTFAFHDMHTGYWHPLTWLSHQLDCQLFGLAADRHHFVSMCYHALVTILVYRLARRLGVDSLAAVIGSAIFSLHPTDVESVAWASERKTILAAVFILFSVLAHLRFLENRGMAWSVMSFGSFCLAAMSRPIAVVLPVILLVLSLWKKDHLLPPFVPSQSDGLEGTGPPPNAKPTKVPEIVIWMACGFVAVLLGVVTIWAQSEAGFLMGTNSYPIACRLANVGLNYGSYAGHLLAPHKLCVFYQLGWPSNKTSVVMGIGFLVILVWGAIRLRHRAPMLALSIAWFLIFLFPVCGLFQAGSQQIADHYLYLPIILPCISFADAITRHMRKAPVWFFVCIFCVLTLEGVITRQQIATWKSQGSLFSNCLRQGRESGMALAMAGTAEAEIGNYAAAHEHLTRSLLWDPDSGFACFQLGVLHFRQKNFGKSAAYFREAARLHASGMNPYTMLGEALTRKGDVKRGAEAFRKAIKMGPDSDENSDELSLPLAELSLLISCSTETNLGTAQESVQFARRAMELGSSNYVAYIAYGSALKSINETNQAVAILKKGSFMARLYGYKELESELQDLANSCSSGISLKTNMPLRVIWFPD